MSNKDDFLSSLESGSIYSKLNETQGQPSLGYAQDLTDGNVKDVIHSKQFVDDMRDFYKWRDGEDLISDDQVRDKFVSDRRWRNLMDWNMATDIVESRNWSADRKAQMARAQAVYDALPIGTNNEGDRTVGGMLGAAKFAPFNVTNLIPGGSGGRAGLLAAKEAAVAAGGEISRAALLSKAAKAGLIQGAKVDAGVNAALGFGIDAVTQARNKEIGLQKDYSLTEGLVSAGAGGLFGGIMGGLIGAGAGAMEANAVQKIAQKVGRPVDEVLQKATSGQFKDWNELERSYSPSSESNPSGADPNQNKMLSTPAEQDAAQAAAKSTNSGPTTESIRSDMDKYLEARTKTLQTHIDAASDQILAEGGEGALQKFMAGSIKEEELTDSMKLLRDLQETRANTERIFKWPQERGAIQNELNNLSAVEKPTPHIQERIDDLRDQLRRGDDSFGAIERAVATGKDSSSLDAITEASAPKKPEKAVEQQAAQPQVQQAQPAQEFTPKFFENEAAAADATPDDIAKEHAAAISSKSAPAGYTDRLESMYAEKTNGQPIPKADASIRDVPDLQPGAETGAAPVPAAPVAPEKEITQEAVSNALISADKEYQRLSKQISRLQAKQDAGSARPEEAATLKDLISQRSKITAAKKDLEAAVASRLEPESTEVNAQRVTAETPDDQALSMVMADMVTSDPDNAMLLVHNEELMRAVIEGLEIPFQKKGAILSKYETYLNDASINIYDNYMAATGASHDEVMDGIAAVYGNDMADRIMNRLDSPKQEMKVMKEPEGWSGLTDAQKQVIDSQTRSYEMRARGRIGSSLLSESQIKAEVARFRQGRVAQILVDEIAKDAERLGFRTSTAPSDITAVVDNGQQVTGNRIVQGPKAYSADNIKGDYAQTRSVNKPAGIVAPAQGGLVIGRAEDGSLVIEYPFDKSMGQLFLRDVKRDANGQIILKSGWKDRYSAGESALFAIRKAAQENKTNRMENSNRAKIKTVDELIKKARAAGLEKSHIDELKAIRKQLVTEGEKITEREAAGRETERLKSNPELVSRITSKVSAAEQTSDQAAAEQFNRDVRGITLREAIKAAQRLNPEASADAVEANIASIAPFIPDGMTPEEVSMAYDAVSKQNRLVARKQAQAEALRAVADELQATGDVRAATARISEIMTGVGLPKAPQPSDIKPVGVKHEPRVVVINGVEVDVRNQFEYKKLGEGVFDVNFNGDRVGGLLGTKDGGVVAVNFLTGKTSQPFANARDAMDQLPSMFWPQVKEAYSSGRLAGALSDAETSAVYPVDWKTSKTYGEVKRTVPVTDAVPEQAALPPVKVADFTNKEISALNVDLNEGEALAVQFTSGKFKGVTYVENVRSNPPQTVAQIMGRKQGDFVVGAVPEGTRSGHPSATSSFRPIDQGAMRVEPKEVDRGISANMSKSSDSAFDKETGQALFSRLDRIEINEADLPPAYQGQGINNAAVLYDRIVRANNIEWSQIATAGDYAKFVTTLMDMNKIMARVAPEGIRLPNTTRAASMKSVRTIMTGHDDVTVSTALDVLRRLAISDRDMPIIHNSRNELSYQMPVSGTDGANRINFDPSVLNVDGESIVPPPVALIHELAHWAYNNVLNPEDQNEFWLSLGKYYGLSDQNMEAIRAGRIGDISPDLMAAKLDINDIRRRLPGIAPDHEISSPAEMFANQMAQWAVSGGKVNNISLWKKMARYISAIADAFGVRIFGKGDIASISDNFNLVDQDFVKLFNKVLPDEENIFSRYVELSKALKKSSGREGAASLAAKQLMNMDFNRWELHEAINNMSPEAIENAIFNVSRDIYSAYGGKNGAITLSGVNGLNGTKRVRLLDHPSRIVTKYKLLGEQAKALKYIREQNRLRGTVPFEAVADNAMSAEIWDRIEQNAASAIEGEDSSGQLASQMDVIQERAQLHSDPEYIAKLVEHANAIDEAMYYAQIKMRDVIKTSLSTNDKIVNVLPTGQLVERARAKNAQSSIAQRAAIAQKNKFLKEMTSQVKADELAAINSRELPEIADVDYLPSRSIKDMTTEQISKEIGMLPKSQRKNDLVAEYIARKNTELNKPKYINTEYLGKNPGTLNGMLRDAMRKGDMDKASEIADALNFLKGDDAPVLRVSDDKAQAVVTAVRNDTIGVSDNGIPGNAPAQVHELVSKFTHRNKGVERSMHEMAYRLFAMMGKADSLKTPDPINAEDIVKLSGVADVDPDNITQSAGFRSLMNNLRDIASNLNDRTQAIDSAERVMEYVSRASLSDRERIVLNRIIEKLPQSDKDFASENLHGWVAEQYGNFLRGKLDSMKKFDGVDDKTLETMKDVLATMQERVAVVMEGMGPSREIQAMKIFGGQFRRDEHPVVSAVKATDVDNVSPGIAKKYAMERIAQMPEREKAHLAAFAGTTTGNLKSKVGYVLSHSANADGDLVYTSRLGTGAHIVEDLTPEYIQAMEEVVSRAGSDTSSFFSPRKREVIRAHAKAIQKIYGQLQKDSGNPRIIKRLLQNEAAHWAALKKFTGNEASRVSAQPVIARALNTFDFSNKAVYSTNDGSPVSVNWLLDKLKAKNIMGDSQVSAIKRDLGDSFTGQQLYTALTSPDYGMRQSDGIVINELLRDAGYDSIRTYDEDAKSNVKFVFDSENVRSIDDPSISRMAADEMGLNQVDMPKLGGLLVKDITEAAGRLDTRQFDNIAAVAQKMNVPLSVTKIMKKISHDKPMTKADVEEIRKFNAPIQLRSNASRLDYVGANWMADRIAPQNGANGYYEMKESDMGKRLSPILDKLKELPDSHNGLTNFINKTKFWGEVEQPGSHQRIVAAIRRGPKAVANLKDDERKVAQLIQKTLSDELRDMRDAGIEVGEIDNYLPQVWNIEEIKRSPEEFTKVMTNFFEREIMNGNSPMRTGKTPKETAQEKAVLMFNRMTADGSGVIVGDTPLSRGLENSLYSRVINLTPFDLDTGAQKFLQNNLESLLVTYFDKTTARKAYARKFGVNGHAVNSYIRIAADGREAAVSTLMNSLNTNVLARAADATLEEKVLIENHVIPSVKGSKEDVQDLVDAVVQVLGRTRDERQANKSKAKLLLLESQDRDLRTNPEFEKRVDAVVNGLADFGPDGAGVARSDILHMKQTMNAIERKPIDGAITNDIMMKTSKYLRDFNSITLLSYTAIASLPDVAMPLIRSGNMSAWMNGWKNYSTRPEYRAAARNLGVAIGNLAFERMAEMNNQMHSRFSHAFFNVTGLASWTKVQREVSAIVGFEAFKDAISTVRKAQAYGNLDTNSYKASMRFLRRYGLENYTAPGAPSIESLSAMYDNDQVRLAIMKFANDTIFTPNPNDIPVWAQTPIGMLAFQLKSYPLMMARLSGHVIREAKAGNVKPLIALATAGAGLGATTMAARDFIQARGGEDDQSASLRNRNLSKTAENIYSALNRVGLAPPEGSWSDQALGWYVQSIITAGGLGLLAETLYNSAEQLDNGAYGRSRIWGQVLGPTYGLGDQAINVAAGVQQALGDTGKNDKERQAVRDVLSRIPVIGGNKSIRETVTDAIAGEKSTPGGDGMDDPFGSFDIYK